MTKPRKPRADKPKLELTRWHCSWCFRPVKLPGSPPDKCEHCGYTGFISPELIQNHIPRDGETQA